MMTRIAIALLFCGICGCSPPDMIDPVPQSFQVKGDVLRPGEYVLLDDMTLLKGIVSAGGYTDSMVETQIIRNGKPVYKIDGRKLKNLTPSEDPKLKNGDIIILRR